MAGRRRLPGQPGAGQLEHPLRVHSRVTCVLGGVGEPLVSQEVLATRRLSMSTHTDSVELLDVGVSAGMWLPEEDIASSLTSWVWC